MKILLEKREALYTSLVAVFVMITCLFVSVWIQGITRDIFTVPLALGTGRDDSSLLVAVKNLFETGTLEKAARLGAPFKADFYDFPVTFTLRFDFLIIRLFSVLFSSNAFIATSLYYISLPMLIGVCAFLSFREIGMVRWISAGGAIVFTFLPFYFFRGIEHFGLTTYEFVPLAFLLCIWGYRQKIFTPLTRSALLSNRRNWLALLFCVLIANNGCGYWPPFSCFFILLTAVFAVWDTKKRMAAVACLVPIALITCFFLISISPSIAYRMEHGKNPIVAHRAVHESEINGLKIAQMVIPYEIPGNTEWERKLKKYHDNAPLVNENRTSYLGLVGTIGFLWLLFRAFRMQTSAGGGLVDLFTRLNLAGTLLAVIGGLATVLAILQGEGVMLRSYNRISVFLGFLSIGAVCWYFDEQWRKAKGKKQYAVVAGAGALMIAHFALLYPWIHHVTDFRGLKMQYQDNQNYFAEIETELPAGAMVYQMPYHPFPEGGPVHQMGDYQLFTGFLYSEALRWSYGGMKGRGGDAWHARVAALPMEERLKVLALTGFSGVYVDRRAYTSEECEKLEDELRRRLQVTPLENADRQIVFYSMLPYNHIMLANYTTEEQVKIRNELLRVCQITKHQGVYSTEQNDTGPRWQWMDRVAEWEILNEGDEYRQEVVLTIAVGAVPSANLTVTVNGEIFTYEISQEGTRIELPLRIVPGKNRIRMETDAPIFTSQDGHSLYMRFVDGSEKAFLPSLMIPAPIQKTNNGGIV